MSTNLTPDEQLRADRDLLAAISRWTRHVGWMPSERGVWLSPDEETAVEPVVGSVKVWWTWSSDRNIPDYYRVRSVSQGVDVLCALGILPVEFSSGWHAGQHAADICPPPGLVRVWDGDGNQWDRRADGRWVMASDDTWDADWLELNHAYGPIDVTPALLVGGEPGPVPDCCICDPAQCATDESGQHCADRSCGRCLHGCPAPDESQCCQGVTR